MLNTAWYYISAYMFVFSADLQILKADHQLYHSQIELLDFEIMYRHILMRFTKWAVSIMAWSHGPSPAGILVKEEGGGLTTHNQCFWRYGEGGVEHHFGEAAATAGLVPAKIDAVYQHTLYWWLFTYV